jgi:tRNA pseudouridine55 synthase
MARGKRGRSVHGWLILDKPPGMTSTQAVSAVRRIFNARKAGHAGTLDPLATGILPIALGEATKTVPHAVDGEKRYRFTVRWGIETDTDDIEGKVLESRDDRPSRTAIEDSLQGFTGEILQRPPAFSAIKIAGNRAYDLARAGESIELEPREVQIFELTLIGMPDRDHAVFETRCGKGTYVRALARDLGRSLGCLGHLTELRRTLVGGFDEESGITLAELNEAAGKGEAALGELLLPVQSALHDLMSWDVGQTDAARLVRGQSILIRGRDVPPSGAAGYATCKGRLIALGRIDRGQMHPFRVFNFAAD